MSKTSNKCTNNPNLDILNSIFADSYQRCGEDGVNNLYKASLAGGLTGSCLMVTLDKCCN